MSYDDLFIDIRETQVLSKEEINSYFLKYRQGDLKAREQLIIHNIKLVLFRVRKKFFNTSYDEKELVSIGLIGLIKSVDTFDIDKNVAFSTYAVRYIDNEILMFLRKGKKFANDQSMNITIATNADGNERTLEDILEDDTVDFVSEYEDQITYHEVRKIIYNLPDRERKIILLYFGFLNGQEYTQKEIAHKLNISPSCVSKLILKIVKKIKMQLQSNDGIKMFETVDRTSERTKSNLSPYSTYKIIINQGAKHKKEPDTKTLNTEKRSEKKRGRKLQTIYEYFSRYTKEEIDTMLSKLTEAEKELIKLRYGEDLDHPVTSELWGREDYQKFYCSLVPVMKKLLSNPNGKRKKKSTQDQAVIDENIQPVVIPVEATGFEHKERQEIILQKTNPVSKETSLELEKGDYTRILELMKTPDFGEMLKSLTPKEAVIICLKLGYVDGKYFTTESIAGFLGIEKAEVIETTKKILLVYKETVNQFIDTAIEVTARESVTEEKMQKSFK